MSTDKSVLERLKDIDAEAEQVAKNISELQQNHRRMLERGAFYSDLMASSRKIDELRKQLDKLEKKRKHLEKKLEG